MRICGLTLMLILSLAGPVCQGVYHSTNPPLQATSPSLAFAPFPTVPQASGQNLSSYYCPTPEERVYISLGGDVYNPANLSIGLGAFIIWSSYSSPLPSMTHTITANITANGSLPFFNATLPPQNQFGYTFTVPGTYHYYDKYVSSNKGVITVHPRVLVGNSVLGVSEIPSNPNIIVNQFNVNGTSFMVNVVATNAASLSSFEICLQYDTNTAQETALTFAPRWDAAYNPNALGTGSIYSGDGVIRADSYILNGGPGGNATGTTVLFSATFNALNFGYGSLQLTGYLVDSNGNYISYIRQNGSYRVIPLAAFYYAATYFGHPISGTNVTVHNNFSNVGQRRDKVIFAQISTDFGVFIQSTGLPLEIVSLTNATLFMQMAIPSTATPGVHHVTLSASWQYLVVNQTAGTSSWVNGPNLSGSGTITIQAPTTPSSIITNVLVNILVANWRLIVLGAAVTWIALTVGAIGLLINGKKYRPQTISWSQTEKPDELRA